MLVKLRPLRLPDDYAQLAALMNEYWSEPTTAEKLEEEDKKLYRVGKTGLDERGRLIGYDRERQAAVDDEGRIIGIAWAWRAPWTEPGYLILTLVVSRSHRKLGVGKRLLQHVADWGVKLGASTFVTEVWDDDADSLRFAQRKGFTEERHTFQSLLDLEPYEERVGEDALQKVEATGFRLLTLADEPGEANERKLYEMYVATLKDIPGYLGDVPNQSDWRKWYLFPEGDRPEMVLLAAEGDQYVGVANLLQNRQTMGMYHEYTGVHAGYRGRGIALALKVLAIRVALRCRAPYLRTDNDSLNAPMLAINRRLGFRPLRGRYRMLASLEQIQIR